MKKIKGQARVALRTPGDRRSSQAVSQWQRPWRPRGHALAPRKPDRAGPPSARGRARPPGTGSAGRGRRTTCPVGLRSAAPGGGRLSPFTATAAAAAAESVAAAAAATAAAAAPGWGATSFRFKAELRGKWRRAVSGDKGRAAAGERVEGEAEERGRVPQGCGEPAAPAPRRRWGARCARGARGHFRGVGAAPLSRSLWAARGRGRGVEAGRQLAWGCEGGPHAEGVTPRSLGETAGGPLFPPVPEVLPSCSSWVASESSPRPPPPAASVSLGSSEELEGGGKAHCSPLSPIPASEWYREAAGILLPCFLLHLGRFKYF